MKRFIAIIISLTVIASMLAACSNNGSGEKNDEGKINIVTTIFPIYDWTLNVIGDDENAEVSFLLDNGADLHNYQPTADDMVKISDCDVFIYVGGESEKWVDDALKNAVNKNMVVINLLDVLKDRVKEEEIKEGMQSEEEEEESEEGPEYDEHIWLSIKNAQICVTEIAKQLSLIGKEGNNYISSAKEYNDDLAFIDKELEALVYEVKAQKKPNVLLFGDRFPFRYLVDDYGIDYYAAFAGCSAESEVSFETISFLSNKFDELGLEYVIALEGSDQKLAKTIIENTKTKKAGILELNSMQSITQQDVDKGANYYDIMSLNMGVLCEALLGIPYGGNAETE